MSIIGRRPNVFANGVHHMLEAPIISTLTYICQLPFQPSLPRAIHTEIRRVSCEKLGGGINTAGVA
jgi:hypothetical protein